VKVFEDELNNKIDSNHPALATLVKVGQGMQTAANDVYTCGEIAGFPPNFTRKRLEGDAIKKYFITGDTPFLLYVEDVFSFDDLPKIIREYLLQHESKLKNRAAIKRNKHSIWWKYTWPLHKELYHLDKIWCSYRGKENCFAFDDAGEYVGLTNTTVIFDTNESVNLKYLLALLNSKTLNYRYRTIGKQTGGGIFEYFENGVGKLPIPMIDGKEQIPFVDTINGILAIKQSDPTADTSTLETEIDRMVYELYGLTEEEIKIVEGAV
jgi:hypothetical protein